MITNQAEYDVAKKTLEIPHVDFIMNAQGLRDQMLEYRRANNIYEVGDLVVLTKEYSTNLIQEIVKIENLSPQSKNIEPTYFMKSSLGCWSFQIRHATDAEIEANRRLGLPESVVKSLGEVS